MPPKSSEYGATPDTEKGESDEDTPRLMCWCFHATRRMLRTILIVVPLTVLGLLSWMLGFLAPYFAAFTVMWIPSVWFALGWTEKFPAELQVFVAAVFVNYLLTGFVLPELGINTGRVEDLDLDGGSSMWDVYG